MDRGRTSATRQRGSRPDRAVPPVALSLCDRDGPDWRVDRAAPTMLRSTVPTTKLLAGVAGALTAGLFLGSVPAQPRLSAALQFGAAIGYTLTFYFYGRARTDDVVDYSAARSAIGFLLAGGAVGLWVVASAVYRIDLTAPQRLSRVLLAAMIVGLVVGLAHVGWTTGRLSETLAIRRERDDSA